MELTPTNLKNLRTTFNGDFRQGYDKAPIKYNQVTTQVPSNSEQNTYGWMASLRPMREWVGPRVVENIGNQSFVIVNKTFEKTTGIKREHIEDDNLGIYGPMIQEFGAQVRKHPDDLVTSLLQNGHTSLCYDGQYFFDTDHPVNPNDAGVGSVQQNYWANGKALTKANAMLVRSKMRGFRGEDNRPLGVIPRTLIVPPALEEVALEISTSTIIKDNTVAAGVSNVARGLFDVLVWDELDGQDTTWYLADLSRVIKPFVFQTRRQPGFVALTNPDDPNVFAMNEYLFGTDGRYNAGYALWFLCSKMVA